jgi:hypothetical protein
MELFKDIKEWFYYKITSILIVIASKYCDFKESKILRNTERELAIETVLRENILTYFKKVNITPDLKPYRICYNLETDNISVCQIQTKDYVYTLRFLVAAKDDELYCYYWFSGPQFMHSNFKLFMPSMTLEVRLLFGIQYSRNLIDKLIKRFMKEYFVDKFKISKHKC